MSGYNLPPGVSVNDIPDNEPEKPRSQPPAPSKWAMEAAKEIPLPGRIVGSGKGMSDMDARFMARERNAAIIQRHHAAAQAETVALLNECSGTIKLLYRDKSSVIVGNCNDLLDRLAAHLAQLKEGGTAIEAARAQEASNE